MKYVMLVGDGMADYPVPSLHNRTPLQAARAVNMRRLTAAGRVTSIQTVVPQLAPGSDVANLSLLGYNPLENYTGRAPIEAAGAGLAMGPQEVAYRCNLTTVRGGVMEDYSGGHIGTAEAHVLVADLAQRLNRPGLRLHGGVSYRHLLLWEGGPTELTTQPPHDIADRPVEPYLPKGERQDEVRALMEGSKAVLADHPVNRARVARGERPVTQIWLWGQGRALSLASYAEKFGLGGIVVSAVDLVRGLGKLAGLQAPVIPGATGFLDTNYEGKVAAALESLRSEDFAYVHIEAPDECGHMGDAAKKTEGISLFDERVVGPVWRELEARGEPYRLIVAMDHRTPVAVRGHTREPVPILVVDGPTGPLQREAAFDESCCDGVEPVWAWDYIAAQLRRS